MIEDKNFILGASKISGMQAIDPLDSNIKFYGAPWIKDNKNYYRLPKSQEELLIKASVNCYNLGRHSSGIQMHFVTTSSKLVLQAKVSNTSKLSGMTNVAQRGFDCYVGKDYNSLLFYDTTRFTENAESYQYTLFKGLNKEEKLVVINFPLYNVVEELLLYIDDDSLISEPLTDISKLNKFVVYGTSITQGGCASRPGLSYTNILSRRFPCEFINLGFSGNAFGENQYAKIMSEINDVTMFFLSYEANAGTNGKLEETLDDFYSTIRKSHPSTPIVIISRIKYLFDDLNPNTLGARREEIRKFQASFVERKRKLDKHVYYINGSNLLGDKYDEYTIDSIHPNDLGFMKIADNLEIEINKILRQIEKEK